MTINEFVEKLTYEEKQLRRQRPLDPRAESL
jgi:hypothetical protein